MDEKNIRFKELRTHLKLSQEKFGAEIGLSKSGISSIENGARNVSETHIKLLESSFGINGNWLRYGGEESMFSKTEGISFDEYAKQKGATPLDVQIMKAYLDIEPTKRKEVLNALKILFNKSDTTDETSATKSDIELETFIANVRLEDEKIKKGEISSASPEKDLKENIS